MVDLGRVVVLGGSGMIGARVAKLLQGRGIETIAASRRTGVNTLTGEGLDGALADADIVVDASDVHSFDPATLRDFFLTAGRNVAEAERRAGIKHHVTLSIVGVDAAIGNPYYASKVGQEEVVRASRIPFTIARSTQFYEFLPTIANGLSTGTEVELPDALLQPIAADDVARILVDIALSGPRNDKVAIAGPERAPLVDWINRLFASTGDGRSTAVRSSATWFGAPLQAESIIPAHADYLGTIPFEQWIESVSARAAFGKDRYAAATGTISAHSDSAQS